MMKYILMIFWLGVFAFANSYFTIGHSRLINNNILIFQSNDSKEKIVFEVNNGQLSSKLLPENPILSKSLKDLFGKENIFTLSIFIKKVVNKERLPKEFFIIYKNRIVRYLKTEIHEEQETLFGYKKVTITSIKPLAIFNLNLLKSEDTYKNFNIKIIHDNMKNFLSFSIGKENYNLKKVNNLKLEHFLKLQSKLLKDFDKNKEKVTAYYTKKDGYKLKKMSISYEFMKDKKNTPLLVTLLQDKKNKKIQSTAEIYDLKKYHVLFEFKGAARNKNILLFKFTQSPSTEDVFLENAIGEKSTYSRQGVYFYNQAGLLYLLSWMRKNGMNKQSAFVFSGNTDALVTKIKSSGHNYNIIYKNDSQKVQVSDNGFLQKIGDYTFEGIETPSLKALKVKENIIRVYQ